MKRILYLTLVLFVLFTSCLNNSDKLLDKGVSVELADFRKENYSEVKYTLSFLIPSNIKDSINGRAIISCFNKSRKNIILDFRAENTMIKNVALNGINTEYLFKNNHIIIDRANINTENVSVEIDFVAGDMSLNRNEDFLYTLFVPDRASTAFPCFDQPNIKANYRLSLEVDKNWIAVSNGAVDSTIEKCNSKIIQFKETDKISTYLFSFATGIFYTTALKCDNREVLFYHRIKDKEKLNRNIPEIERLITKSIQFNEAYTDVKYPFGKYDLIAIPSFQYGGMEHPGNIYYRESKLFLEESATKTDIMARANLIAHETAHIWFGDLVTMNWFDEVWLKEVFANFIADKIVSQSFPDENFDLNFLLSHYPQSYSVDRTDGANSITTPLNNLLNAGSVYGNIIYHKAPIVMRQLENIIGQEQLKLGVQEYVKQYAYGNATWSNLIYILDQKSSQDLTKWSDSWVFNAGMTHVNILNSGNDCEIIQTDPLKRNVIWAQNIKVDFLTDEGLKDTTVFLDKNNVQFNYSTAKSNVCILNSDGSAYGYFKLNNSTINYIAQNINITTDEVTRAAYWLNLWENFINNNVDANIMANMFVESLEKEKSPMLLNQICSYYKTFYWMFISESKRNDLSDKVESQLITRIENEEGNIKYSLFKLLQSMFITDNSYHILYDIWSSQKNNLGLTVSEKDYTELCYNLALRNSEMADSIISIQYKRIINNDERKKFEFVSRALNSSKQERDKLFLSFSKESNRAVEPWVCQALSYLNSPLRGDEADSRILEGLELLEEIQQTGDIFFPKAWLEALYSNASSKITVEITDSFLLNRPNYPDHLKRKILQSVDLCKRATICKAN